MDIKIKSRDPFVRASFERKNAMGKGRAILSDRDRSKRERSFRKREFLREKRSGYDDGSFSVSGRMFRSLMKYNFPILPVPLP
jgi:hypothetical protein